MAKYVLKIVTVLLTLNSVSAQTSFFEKLADSTLTLTKQVVRYNPTYFKLEYPNGDVPKDKGV